MFTATIAKGLGILIFENTISAKLRINNCKFVHHVAKILTHIKPYEHNIKVDVNNQSIVLPGPERIRVSRLIDSSTTLNYDVPGSPHIRTIYDCLEHGLKISDDGDCAGTRSPVTGEYDWLKFSEVKLKSQYIGSALLHLGLKPNSESFVGIFANNKVEFFLTLCACAGYSLVLVPIYDCIGPSGVEFIIKKMNFLVVMANNNRNATLVLQSAEKFPFLKAIVILESPSHETKTLAENAKIRLITLDELEEIGKSNFKETIRSKPEDIFCITYTSGTTGIPKGVMLTHQNLLACLSAITIAYGKNGFYGGTIISYLPPAHVYEIMNQISSLYFARRTAFYSGELKNIVDEIRYLQPNILPFVPRLMNAVHEKVMSELKKNKLKRTIFEFALSRKEKMLKKGIVSSTTIWDKLIFKKFRAAMGGNVDIIVTTSAPLAMDVNRLFRCASGSSVFEAYGQTETLVATFTLPQEHMGEHVGPPVPHAQVKLIDIPSMGYYAENDEGEVCCRGPSISKGYYKLPANTEALIDSDGWLHSGDVGKWLPNGTLKIIDRKKNIFKLSQGEYIAPDKVEGIYGSSPLILQVYMDGFPDKDYVVGIIVCEPTIFSAWIEQQGFSKLKKEQLLTDKTVRTALLKELREFGAEKNLNSLEQPRNIWIIDEPFTVENDLLTPTLKLKRDVGRKHFKDLLNLMYDEGPLIKFSKEK